MIEVNRYPEDFDGVLVGDPYFDVPGQNLNVSNATVQLRSSDASLAPPAFALATGIVLASCDAVDGVAAGIERLRAVRAADRNRHAHFA